MKYTKIVFFLAVVMLFSAFGLRSCQSDQTTEVPDPVTLQFWRVFDDRDTFEPIIAEYQRLNPHVTIEYKKFTFLEYENAVVNALASGRGPDIWSIHNTWLPQHGDKLAPAPAEIVPAQAYRDTFVEVAQKDFIRNDQVYAVPLSVDTLALYYNRDLFNSSFVVDPPQDWTEFRETVEKITRKDEFEEVTLSGAAIGTAVNVNRAQDILSLLMLQNGAQMDSEDLSAATFNQSRIDSTGQEYFPAVDALEYYTDFANPRRAEYTWNTSMANSLDAFIAEETAMMFNYGYQRAILDEKAPKLNYGVSAMPQIEGSPKTTNFATYWGEAVSKQSQNQEEAWKFLAFLATKEVGDSYFEASKRPPARLDIIRDLENDPEFGVFAQQALTATSWAQPDNVSVDAIFSEMIDSVVLGVLESQDAIDQATQKVTSLFLALPDPENF